MLRAPLIALQNQKRGLEGNRRDLLLQATGQTHIGCGLFSLIHSKIAFAHVHLQKPNSAASHRTLWLLLASKCTYQILLNVYSIFRWSDNPVKCLMYTRFRNGSKLIFRTSKTECEFLTLR